MQNKIKTRTVELGRGGLWLIILVLLPESEL